MANITDDYINCDICNTPVIRHLTKPKDTGFSLLCGVCTEAFREESELQAEYKRTQADTINALRSGIKELMGTSAAAPQLREALELTAALLAAASRGTPISEESQAKVLGRVVKVGDVLDMADAAIGKATGETK